MAKSKTTSSLRDKGRSVAIDIYDEFANLKEVHRAYACVGGLLSPVHHPPELEEFSFELGDLRALMNLITDEMERRTESVDDAIQTLSDTFKVKGKAPSKARKD